MGEGYPDRPPRDSGYQRIYMGVIGWAGIDNRHIIGQPHGLRAGIGERRRVSAQAGQRGATKACIACAGGRCHSYQTESLLLRPVTRIRHKAFIFVGIFYQTGVQSNAVNHPNPENAHTSANWAACRCYRYPTFPLTRGMLSALSAAHPHPVPGSES